MINYNPKLKLAFSDVDETIADVYTPAEPGMIDALSSFLAAGGKLFMVTGGSLKRVRRDITDRIDPALRRDILISHCSGAEVWGFMADGSLRDMPFYSEYEKTFTPGMKETWRELIDQVVTEFKLRTHSARPKPEFWETIGRDPLDIMLDDRGPQITMEVVNGLDVSPEDQTKLGYEIPLTNGVHDLRTLISQRATELFKAANIPISPRFGGTYAIDFAIEHVSKTTSIQAVLSMPEVLDSIGLKLEELQDPTELEIWGDKFSTVNGGTDRHICAALDPTIRTIDFRQESPDELPPEYNIVIWNGQQHLHHGLLEYLQARG